jgi:hypothetical protein
MKVKVQVPTSLSDIKLSQYQKFLKTTEGSEDNDWVNKQAIAIFCNLSDKLVKQIHRKDFNNVLNTINSIIETQGTFKPIINYKGKEYGFIPKLEDITVGEQADIDSMIGDWQKMDRVMGIVYRPIISKRGNKYLIEDYSDEVEPLDLPMDIVQGAMVFFYNLMNDLLSCTQSYMNQAVTNPKASQILEENGVGIKTFMDSLEVTFSSLKMCLNLNLMRR